MKFVQFIHLIQFIFLCSSSPPPRPRVGGRPVIPPPKLNEMEKWVFGKALTGVRHQKERAREWDLYSAARWRKCCRGRRSSRGGGGANNKTIPIQTDTLTSSAEEQRGAPIDGNMNE